MTWAWRLLSVDGAPVASEGVAPGSFPSQSEAESWLGEAWRDLRAAGVGSVTLLDGDREVYGPMSLSE